MLTPKTKAAGQAANDNQQLLHSNYTLPRIMSRFFLPQFRRAPRSSELRMCRNGCGRPVTSSRPVCRECHRLDYQRNYAAKRLEHQAWRKRMGFDE